MAHTNTKYLSMHIGWSKKVLGEKSLDVNQAVGSEFDIDLCLISLFAMIEVLDVSWKEPLDTSSQCYLSQWVEIVYEGAKKNPFKNSSQKIPPLKKNPSQRNLKKKFP